MMRLTVFFSISVLLLSFVPVVVSSSLISASPSVIRVPQDYGTIQEAVNSADSGDVIYVQSGIYYEHVIVSKSNLTLIGENRYTTVIDGQGGNTISLKANNVTIYGFTLTQGYSGVQIFPWTHGHVIRNNSVLDNDFGIRGHYDVHDVAISHNLIASNTHVGIELAFCYSEISENIIANNGKGAYAELSAGIQVVESVYDVTISSNNNRIVENVIMNNVNGVLPIRYSEHNLFRHNSFVNNTRSFPVSVSSTMINNTVEENYWSDYHGEDVNRDGFGDVPYVLDAEIADAHPLISPYSYWVNPVVGDVDRNMRVDIKDIAIAARAFGTYAIHPNWNANADVNRDNKVDIIDLVLIAKNFGKTQSSDWMMFSVGFH